MLGSSGRLRTEMETEHLFTLHNLLPDEEEEGKKERRIGVDLTSWSGKTER